MEPSSRSGYCVGARGSPGGAAGDLSRRQPVTRPAVRWLPTGPEWGQLPQLMPVESGLGWADPSGRPCTSRPPSTISPGTDTRSIQPTSPAHLVGTPQHQPARPLPHRQPRAPHRTPTAAHQVTQDPEPILVTGPTQLTSCRPRTLSLGSNPPPRAARASRQMISHLVVLGLGVRVIVGAVKGARQRRPHDAGTGRPSKQRPAHDGGAAARRHRRALPWKALPPQAGPHPQGAKIEMAHVSLRAPQAATVVVLGYSAHRRGAVGGHRAWHLTGCAGHSPRVSPFGRAGRMRGWPLVKAI
jgi:hypothetical protein